LTISVALALSPLPPLVEPTGELVLTLEPAVVPVTLNEIVQETFAAMLTPARLTLLPPAGAVRLPPHELVRPLGFATRSPAGNASVNVTPVSVVDGLGLLIVKVSNDVPPTAIDAGAKLLDNTGGASVVTSSDALALLPLPALVDVTLDVLLTFVPVDVPVTLSEIVQDAEAARFPPDKFTFPPPAGAVRLPPHELVAPLGLATSSPAGNASVKATPVSAVPGLELAIVKVSDVVPPIGISEEAKLLVIEGGDTMSTESVALALPPVPPLVEVIDELVLTFVPAVVPVTLSEIVQDAEAATVPPDRFTFPPPAAAVTLPPHELVTPLGLPTTSPAGKASVNATPVSAVEELGLVIVKVSNDVPPAEIDAGAKLLANPGGLTVVTSSEALALFPLPPFVELTLEELLTLVPAVVPITLTETVQDAEAATVAPDRLTLLPPVDALPPQLLLCKLTTVSPAGNVSVNATPVSAADVFGLVIEKFSTDVPPTAIEDGVKLLAIAGGDNAGASMTFRPAFAELPGPWSENSCTGPLFFLPAEVAVTSTTTVHV
jgi:hypothetical protein